MRPKCKLPLRKRYRYWSETCTRPQGERREGVLMYSTLELAEAGRISYLRVIYATNIRLRAVLSVT